MVLSGCEVPILTASSGAPTAAPGMFETIVASTAGAASTRTALYTTPSPTSTWTPLPTHTPSLTPTASPTFLFSYGASRTPTRTPVTPAVVPSSDTPAASDSLDGCVLVSQTPSDGTHFAAKESFKAAWTVENTGSQAWDTDSVDFAYSSGAKMHKKQLYDLPADVPVGEDVTLNVSMLAPNSEGTYDTVWALRRGQNRFCHVNLTIRVP
jgi:Ig-like domain from next to BRCA1 gene